MRLDAEIGPGLSLAVRAGIGEIDAALWDGLLGADDQPFLRHAFLSALEQSGSLQRELGWTPMPLLLEREGQAIAAAPAYLKANSHGEFVFDWAWADAYARNRLPYYPKLLVAVPYTPVTGPRLLVGAGGDRGVRRAAMRRAIESLIAQTQLSSAHLNFLAEPDAAALAHDPWLPRFDWQFHLQRGDWRDFGDYLDAFVHKKRKNIRQERRQARASGLDFAWVDAQDLDEAELDQVHALYCETFERKGNTPALNRSFFSLLRERMPGQFHLALGRRGRRIVAAAIFFSSSTTLYGRYWGASEEWPGVHFELCYYQGIDCLLRRGLQRFEPGAQGQHKLARGFLPTRTRSAHLILHQDFRRAIRQALHRESSALFDHFEELAEHQPFRLEVDPG